MEVIGIFIWGFVAGEIAHKIITDFVTHKSKGVLRIDTSDKIDGAHMFAIFYNSVEDISSGKTVTLDIENTNMLEDSTHE